MAEILPISGKAVIYEVGMTVGTTFIWETMLRGIGQGFDDLPTLWYSTIIVTAILSALIDYLVVYQFPPDHFFPTLINNMIRTVINFGILLTILNLMLINGNQQVLKGLNTYNKLTENDEWFDVLLVDMMQVSMIRLIITAIQAFVFAAVSAYTIPCNL